MGSQNGALPFGERGCPKLTWTFGRLSKWLASPLPRVNSTARGTEEWVSERSLQLTNLANRRPKHLESPHYSRETKKSSQRPSNGVK